VFEKKQKTKNYFLLCSKNVSQLSFFNSTVLIVQYLCIVAHLCQIGFHFYGFVFTLIFNFALNFGFHFVFNLVLISFSFSISFQVPFQF